MWKSLFMDFKGLSVRILPWNWISCKVIMLAYLFSPAILDAIEIKLEKNTNLRDKKLNINLKRHADLSVHLFPRDIGNEVPPPKV